jgi:hypothetical protein
MISRKVTLPMLLGLIGFSVMIPLARADSFGFYATGTFQFDSNTISGNAEGNCEGQCVPWGQIVILDASFSATVLDYQQNVSCANNECETEITGIFGPGSISADLSVFGDSSKSFFLNSSSLQGSFTTRFCTGQCGTYRAETNVSLDFQGLWNNGWYSTGMIQMNCFHTGGCSDGTGGGSLNTDAPEPSAVALLLGGIPCLGFALRRQHISRASVSRKV